jgi:hypothetical protein
MENKTASEMLYESIKAYLPKETMTQTIIEFYVKNAIALENSKMAWSYLQGVKEYRNKGIEWRSYNENPECNGK